MNTAKHFLVLGVVLALALTGCGGNGKPAPREGVVYLDPNAAPAATAAPAEPVQGSDAASPAATQAPEADEGPAEDEPDLFFEGKGVRLEPLMEAAPVLAALGDPIGRFEADSCAYIGKDVFYYYPGFELTVNEVDGVERITNILVADDTVTTPQGLRIYDEEEKLLSLLGGTSDNDVYTYRKGQTLLLIQVKEAEDDTRRIASMEYRVADGQ